MDTDSLQDFSGTIQRLNTHYSSEVLCIARFYGQCPNALNAHVSGLDDGELTIEWELTKDGTTIVQSTSLAMTNSEGSAMRRVLDKAETARIALSAMSIALQQSGDMLPTSIEFLLPPQPIMMSVLSGLAVLLFLASVQPIGLAGLVHWIVPQRVLQLLLYSLAALHAVEAVALFLVCCYVRRLPREYEMNWDAVMQYTMSTLVFGVFTGIVFMRQVMKPPEYVKKKVE
ncbi:hypothetical protein IWW57_001208 [Coemansia sp. S610]|nr:hypothetical protein IWW57_001208 [Coemansia sp. S610]